MQALHKIDEQINLLKKKKEQLQIKATSAFLKEAQNILKNEFSPELALSILSNTWASSSKNQKEEWIKSATSFRSKGNSRNQKATPKK